VNGIQEIESMQSGPKIVFVSFEPGTRGHYIARVIACLPNVYWYSHSDNGTHPWNIASAKNSSIRQRHAFPNHFDRLVPKGKLPPTWDYVQGYFPSETDYYENIFFPQFNELTRDIDQTLVYCTHSVPSQLNRYFSNCQILNVVESADTIVEKYIKTTALFPGWNRFANLVDENNIYLKYLNKLKDKKKDFTVRDLWAQRTHITMYKPKYDNEYKLSLLKKYTKLSELRNQQFENTLNIRMHPDWRAVKDFLLN